MSCRLVHFGGRPGFFPTGSSGSSTVHCASVRSAILDQPGTEPRRLKVAGGDPPQSGMGQLALQVRPAEREQLLAQPGHA